MRISPLSYHRKVVAHLQEHLPAAWSHYASDAFAQTQDEAMRLHLLQTTVALGRGANAALYAMADEVAETLEIGVPVELYQANDSGSLGAMLLFSPSAARVVLEGPMQDRLPPAELRAVIGHELAHHLLYTGEEGRYLCAQRLLAGLAQQTESPSILETYRLWSLSTEVFADRGGLAVSDPTSAISALIRVKTGLSEVSAEDFLAQSHELLDKQGGGSREWSHPEAHIRALIVERQSADTEAEATEAWIREVVEGPLHIDALDLLRREELAQLCKGLVSWLLAPTWFQTPAVLGHVRMLFDDDPLPEPVPIEAGAIEAYGKTVREALAAVLLDFVVLDPGLDELPLLRADQVAEALGLQKLLQQGVNKHLKRTKKAIAKALADRDSRLAAADEADDQAEEDADAG